MASYDDEIVTAFMRNHSRIRRYLERKTGSRQDAEDLAQETWIKLARNSAAALAAPVPYLNRIAQTLALDHLRGRKRLLTSGEMADLLAVADERPDPEQVVRHRDQVRLLMRIMEELPERQRKILVEARLSERRHVDIAAELGVSVRTVELEIRKALDYCSKRLQQINPA